MDYLFYLLTEAPVSWKTIQKAFLSKYGEEGLDNIAKSINFNNFQEFYQDVYGTLQKDVGGRKYEPNSTELIKIFKFLLEKPNIYVKYKNRLTYYGYHRYLNNEQILNELMALRSVFEFESFLENIMNPFVGDMAIDYDSYQKIYSDSNIDIYFIKNYDEIKPICVGTTWCVKDKKWFDTYTMGHLTNFYIIVSKKEWHEQSKGIRKKYALRLPQIIADKEKLDNIKKTLNDIFNSYESIITNSGFFNTFVERQTNKFVNSVINTNNSPHEKTQLWLKTLNVVKKIDTLKINKNGIEYSVDLEDPPREFAFGDWKTYFFIKQLIETIQSLIDSIKSGNYEPLFDNIDELIDSFISRQTIEKDLYSLIPDFNKIKKLFIADDEEKSEFTNNNQNVRLKQFDQLPEPYHSQLKDFRPYRDYVEIKKQINMINEMNLDLLNKHKKLIKENIKNIVKERFKSVDTNYYEKIIESLSQILKTEFPAYRNVKSLGDYYFTKIEDDNLTFFTRTYVYSHMSKADQYALSVRNYGIVKDKRFGDPRYDFYFVYDTKREEEFIVKTLSDDTLKEFEIRIKSLLNDLGLGEEDLSELKRLKSEWLNNYSEEIFKKMFDGLKNKAIKINNIIKDKNLKSYTNNKFSFIIDLFNFFKENPGLTSKLKPSDPENLANKLYARLINLNVKMVLQSISKVDENKEYVCLSLVKSLLLNALFALVGPDFNKFDKLFEENIQEFVTDLQGMDSIDEFVKDSFYSQLPIPDSLLFNPVAIQNTLVGILSRPFFDADIKKMVLTLSNVNFIVNLVKSLKLFGLLKILFNAFTRHTIFVNGEKDSVDKGLSNLVAQIIGKFYVYGNLSNNPGIATINFNDVIDTTEEIKEITSFLLFFEKKFANK